MSFTVPLSIVDAFVVNEKSFSGNPAAVVILDFDDEISDETKQNMAAEMNLSETAFVSFAWSKSTSPEDWKKDQLKRTIRWFTPTNEVPLCGHASLASSTIIFDGLKSESESNPTTTIEFETKFRGRLSATMTWTTGLINLNFPSNPTEEIFGNEHPWLNRLIFCVLGDKIGPKEVHQEIHYSQKTKFILIRLKTPENGSPEDLLSRVRPDFEKLLTFDSNGTVRDYIVTVKGTTSGKPNEPHFYSRFFAPADGINEDPVTGVAHTVLTPYWTQELGPGTFLARQHSQRGGDLFVKLENDRVHMAGRCKINLSGKFFI